MIKVLLQVQNSKRWIGGLNYFINLCEAINSIKEREVEFVIFDDSKKLPAPLCNCESLVKNSDFFSIFPRIILKIMRRYLKKSFSEYLKKKRIELVSHGNPLGKFSAIPSLGWIPDFQHKYLTHFFTDQEIKERDCTQSYMAENSKAMLFSSKTAFNDFQRFYPDSKCSAYVLNFVAVPYSNEIYETTDVLKQYDINELFFHIPNQLWAHKNHGIILEALKILKEKGECPLVISTGHTEDYRNPEYFSGLKEKVSNAGLNERFRFLGLIKFGDVAQLMRKSVCLINPSLFEGWSTTVEEGKSLGKRILLSDIPVHQEQAPERGSFFNPADPEALAELMVKVIDEYNPAIEMESMRRADLLLPHRLKQFGMDYQSIVKDIIANNKK